MLRRWHLLLVVVIAIPVAIVINRAVAPVGADQGVAQPQSDARVLESKFYFEEQFRRSVQTAAESPLSVVNDPIRAGIIPHDITQGQMIAHFFRSLQAQSPQRIVVIGPNHYERGSDIVLTTAASWHSGVGTTAADGEAVSWLVDHGYATEDDAVAVDEHSIVGIVPYMTYYLPEARVIPLMLKAEVRLSDIRTLVSALDQLVDDQTVVIAAVDFSHYLTAGQAAANDVVTRQALETLDYQTILSFGPRFNDYVDSPPSIALLLYWLSTHGIVHSEILEHTNSGILTGDMTSPVTSYFEMKYYE